MLFVHRGILVVAAQKKVRQVPALKAERRWAVGWCQSKQAPAELEDDAAQKC